MSTQKLDTRLKFKTSQLIIGILKIDTRKFRQNQL